MRSLFGYLVETLGTRQAIDPQSKDDALWRIVDFFTKSGISEVASFGQDTYNTLADKDIAKYLANRVNDSKAFESTTQVLLRLKNKQALHNDVIQNLKEYAALNNGSIPLSFEAGKVRQAYIRVKSLNETKKMQFTDKNLEYFLYVFKALQMWPEMIDLCSNFDRLSGNAAESLAQNDIKNYYFSDTLLQIPSKEHYHDLLKKAVFEGKEQSDAGYITAMTKAHLKDGAIDHAFKYFGTEFKKLREVRQKKEDFLVSMFDSVYGEIKAADAEISFEEYKEKYLDLIQVSNSCIHESFAVSQLNRVIRDKDFEEVETLFQLYLVQKQENFILQSLPEGFNSEFHQEDNLSEHQLRDLRNLKERKAALQSKLSEKDIAIITNIQKVMKDKKVSVFNKLDERSADEIQKIFNIKSKEDVDEILKKTARYSGVARKLSLYDESSKALAEYHQARTENIEKALSDNIDEMISTQREVPDRNIDKNIEYVYNRKKANPQQDYRNHAYELDQFNDYMLTQDIDDEFDPLNLEAEANDETLAEMKEKLLVAINSRKGKVLNISLRIFNKVQDQQLKTVKFDSVSKANNEETVTGSEVSENLQKYTMLLNDPRSPIYSAIQTLAQYKGDKGVPAFFKLYRDLDDFINHKIDIESLEREHRHLEALNDEVQKTQQSLKNIQSYLVKEQQEINKEMISSASTGFNTWDNTKDQ